MSDNPNICALNNRRKNIAIFCGNIRSAKIFTEKPMVHFYDVASTHDVARTNNVASTYSVAITYDIASTYDVASTYVGQN